MKAGDLCTHCQLAEVVLVPANPYWSPHLQCPRCESTFVLETEPDDDFCQYCCNTGESHGKFCHCKEGQRLGKLEVTLTDQDGHKTVVRGKRADYVLNMLKTPAVSMSARPAAEQKPKPVFVELIATETIGVVPMNITPEAQDMIDKIRTKTRPCTMCGLVRSKDKCGTLRYFCRHHGSLDTDSLECEHYVPQGDDYKSDSTISDYKIRRITKWEIS